MSIKKHRTVEYTYKLGDQDVLNIDTIEYPSQEKDGVSYSILISNNDDNSISIQSRDQLKRLIDNLAWVAANILDHSGDENWDV